MNAALFGSDITMHFAKNPLAKFVQWAMADGIRNVNPGFQTLQPDQAYFDTMTAFMTMNNTILNENQDNYKERMQALSKKLIVFSSHLPKGYRSKSWLSTGLQIVLFFSTIQLDPERKHDGLLYLEDQKPPGGFGVDLGEYSADHIETVVAGLSSRSTTAERLAFTRAMLKVIFAHNVE